VTPDEVKALFPEGAKMVACPSRLGFRGARKLSVHDATDGLGSRILNVIGALRYAEKMNVGFGGLVSLGGGRHRHTT